MGAGRHGWLLGDTANVVFSASPPNIFFLYIFLPVFYVYLCDVLHNSVARRIFDIFVQGLLNII